MTEIKNKIAMVTGASSGFGEAMAWRLAEGGVHLFLGARRTDRLKKVAEKIQKKWDVKVLIHPLDVRETSSVQQFAEASSKHFGSIDILVNNAGLALGLGPALSLEEKDFHQMMETNYLGVFRMTREVAKIMEKQGRGHVVNIGSIAGHVAYEGGGGYCPSKFALKALTQILRLELLEKGIRVSSIDPGMAETEFSLVRFKGDASRAKKVYEGMTPLSAKDIAEALWFIVSRPEHVNIDQILIMPSDQASVSKVRRRAQG